MSDLFCPATLLVTTTSREQVEALAESLRDRRIARVFTSTLPPAVESGAVAARVLGVGAVELQGLEDSGDSGDSGDSDDSQGASARFRAALEEIADLHRGETVLVLTHGGVMASVLPRIATPVRADVVVRAPVPGDDPAELEVDADGIRLLSWPGTGDRATATAAGTP